MLAIAALGVSCELAAPANTAWALLDYGVGLIVAAAALMLAGLSANVRITAATFSILWFGGTLAAASSFGVLAYRAPLLQLLLMASRGRRDLIRASAIACWASALLPFSAARFATVAAAVLVAAMALANVRSVASDERKAMLGGGLAALALAACWTVSVTDLLTSGLALLIVDSATLAAAAAALAGASGLWSLEAERALVIELGPSRRPGLPLAQRIARALADPQLELRFLLPGGWFDEQGNTVAAPDPGALVTRAKAPEGGEVALLHGTGVVPDSRLARAAAAAAALLLESARLDADVRARARDVAESRHRLVTAADRERQELEQQLSKDVLARLQHVDDLLAHDGLTTQRRELKEAVDELVALGRGLYPPTLARHDLPRALHELAQRSPVPATVEVTGDFDAVPEQASAATWFLCSEALANAARHSEATSVHIRAEMTETTLDVEIIDDGHGGATIERGLRGLADRVDALGGTFRLWSPTGGPTRIRAKLPHRT